MNCKSLSEFVSFPIPKFQFLFPSGTPKFSIRKEREKDFSVRKTQREILEKEKKNREREKRKRQTDRHGRR